MERLVDYAAINGRFPFLFQLSVQGNAFSLVSFTQWDNDRYKIDTETSTMARAKMSG